MSSVRPFTPTNLQGKKHYVTNLQYQLINGRVCVIISTNYVTTTMDNEQLLEEMEVQANEDGFIYDDATYALEIEYTTQT
tara:strand:+ start:2955 stop:3194 length:240 start_codon:yes stop_codon:yes gene_type:complete